MGERELSPREALERWLDKQRADKSESSIRTYRYQLKLFVEWCEREGFEPIGGITPWDVDEYELHRRGKNVAPSTIHNELKTLRRFLKYLGQIQVIDADLYQTIEVPGIPPGEASDDTSLDADAALALLEHYRNSEERASRKHVLLELVWHIGARAGGIIAIDLRDFEPEDDLIRFKNRPDTGTRLKNGVEGERVVAILPSVTEIVEEYIDGDRIDIRDEYDRQPLLTSQKGRPRGTTLRAWIYMATQPCIHSPCPHGNQMQTCEYRSYKQAGGCPSSRAPHHVRTGSITYQLNQGMPIERTAERVNATVEVIKRHYDKQNQRAEMEERRRQFVENLEVDS